MKRILAGLALASVLVLGACKSNPTPETALSKEPELQAPERLPGDARKSGLARAGQWTLLVPGNVIWWPWKALGRAGRGVVDGSVGGFDHGYPIYGLLFLPVNAVSGFVTGAFEGAWMGPAVLTPDDDYGRAMAKPLRLPVTVWWYGD